jgi:23S rRNA (uridine2552-2'-O)-methyltransferase
LSRRREERKNHYYRLARRLGYRSRAAFKLKELAQRFNLLRRGDVVVDLGAAPGGWLQVARSLVGDEGFVLGVDVSPIKPLPWSNVKLLRLDVTSPEAPEAILQSLPRRADVILSDLSPKVSGVWELDVARHASLVEAALKVIDAALREGGSAVIKLFQGPGLEEPLRWIEGRFQRVKLTRPKATRPESAEVYAVALGFRLS